MPIKNWSYLILFLLSLASCAGDAFRESSGTEPREFRGTLSLGLSTPDVSVRTRSVSTEPGAPVLVKNLWVGVFDVSTGACIGAKKYEDMHQTMLSGTLVKNLLSVDFVAYGEDLPLAYVVSVANYDGVTTWEGRSLDEMLPADFDHRSAISWDELIGIGIDTRSAYAGGKGEDENADAPFMAGFFQDAVSLTQNPKIDQFAYGAQGPAAIYPAAAADGMDIRLADAVDGKVYVASGALCLRRLVSHNTVRVRMSNGYEVTALRYKRLNMPRAVYLLQRRTDAGHSANFEEWQRRSPNYADRLLPESGFDVSAPDFPYACDDDWIPIEINAWDDREHVEFSFDHFENKHWGADHLASQADREARNGDGTFAALCSGEGDAYNNFASCFILAMHIVNKSTGESADVEYTLHEGFCNDEDGRRTENMAEKCRDFSSFRNVHYTYNVNISGIGDITANATAQDGSEHTHGQNGTVWKMVFATGPSKRPVPVGGGVFDFAGQHVTFSDHPDLGFRICGRDGQGMAVDVCYNMPAGMYEGFAGLWPAGDPLRVSRPDGPSIPQGLLDGMRIGSGTDYYTLPDFVQGVQRGDIAPDGRYSFNFSAYENRFDGLEGSLVRGIYIFDRNDTRNAADADGCTYMLAYGAEQYPFDPQVIRFDEKDILWDNSYYKSAATVKNVFAAAAPIFYGAESSVIDLRWKHDPRILGYKITVFNDSYTHPTIVVGPDAVGRYLRTVGGEKVFVYPLNTAAFPRSGGSGATNYSFSVTPIVDEDIYQPESTVVAHDKGSDDHCIRVCPPLWETSVTTDWKNVMLAGLTGGVEVHYRGLGLYCTSDVGTQYNDKSYICFGGTGNAGNRYFSFVASVPGKLSVTCKSHSTDTSRLLVIARMDENGSQDNGLGEHFDEVYVSESMATGKTTYSTQVWPLDGKPTEFRIYARGSIDYYKIQFTPEN